MPHDVPRRLRHRNPDGPQAIAAAALACALLATALAGCGGGGAGGSTTSGGASTNGGRSTSTATGPSTTASGPSGGSAAGGGGRVAKASPTAVAEGVLTSGDTALVCGRYVTEHYLRIAYGDRQGCVQGQRPGAIAQSVRISAHGAGNGTTEVLIARPAGGPYDGEKVEVTVVKENGAWKVDALHANVPVGP